MSLIVDSKGRPLLGIHSGSISRVNCEDYPLETPMGIKIPKFLRKYAVNQFCFTGIINAGFMAGIAVIDLKYASNAFFYVYLREEKRLIEVKKTYLPLKSCIYISDNPSDPEFYFRSRELSIEFSGRRIKAEARDMKLYAVLDFSGTSPLRLCTRAGYRGWVYTEKTSPVNIRGLLELDAEDRKFSLESPESLAVMDWTSGYMKRHTYWNWASTAFMLENGKKIGLNLSWGVNETGWNENIFWIDGKMTRCGSSIFEFDSDDLMKPWKIYSENGAVDLEFIPEASRSEKKQAVIAASRFTQLSGVFNGTLTTEEGEKLILSGVPGWAEDHYAKW